MKNIALFWFRRDLRLEDNAGLFHALKSGFPVLPVFIFDSNILEDLKNQEDPRVTFIYKAVRKIKKALESRGSTLLVFYGDPKEVFERLIATYPVTAVYTNRDYEPYAVQRDATIADMLQKQGVSWHPFKDHVIFEQGEILKKDGTPYTVFTPYSRKWKAKLDTRQGTSGDSFFLESYPTEDYFDAFVPMVPQEMPTLQSMGFASSTYTFPSAVVPRHRIKKYGETRNFPGIEGTSRLGVHFRFGTISIREKARRARQLSPTYLNELIWRDFYAQILAFFPHVATRSFRPEYDYIEWRNDEDEFSRWCNGETGYPIVDAGMRELNATGYMHNRVRMITASFLTKHLLIDWRWGEAYFAEKLLDFDLASNNGGWQWAAGSGTDAAPYFRIFNPYTQQKKFDKDLHYVKKWVPEIDSAAYPPPIVDHRAARERCLEVYKAGIQNGKAQVG